MASLITLLFATLGLPVLLTDAAGLMVSNQFRVSADTVAAAAGAALIAFVSGIIPSFALRRTFDRIPAARDAVRWAAIVTLVLIVPLAGLDLIDALRSPDWSPIDIAKFLGVIAVPLGAFGGTSIAAGDAFVRWFGDARGLSHAHDMTPTVPVQSETALESVVGRPNRTDVYVLVAQVALVLLLTLVKRPEGMQLVLLAASYFLWARIASRTPGGLPIRFGVLARYASGVLMVASAVSAARAGVPLRYQFWFVTAALVAAAVTRNRLDAQA